MSQSFLLCVGKLRLFASSFDVNVNITRKISLSSVNNGKRNFRKIHLGNKRGTRLFKQQRAAGLYPDMPIETAVKPTGYHYGKKFYPVPEMIPELIVPDLTDFDLKPYVSYKTPNIIEDAFTAKDLFDAVYTPKIADDFTNGNIGPDGASAEPSEHEIQTAEQAFIRARQTGCDLFSERVPKLWEFLETDLTEEYFKKRDG